MLEACVIAFFARALVGSPIEQGASPATVFFEKGAVAIHPIGSKGAFFSRAMRCGVRTRLGTERMFLTRTRVYEGRKHTSITGAFSLYEH